MFDRMVLALAGPPTHTRPPDALHRLSLREFLSLYIDTRAHLRNVRADQLEQQAVTVQAAALAIAPGDGAQQRAQSAQEFAQALRREAQTLRGPEIPPVYTLTDEQDAFLNGWKRLGGGG